MLENKENNIFPSSFLHNHHQFSANSFDNRLCGKNVSLETKKGTLTMLYLAAILRVSLTNKKAMYSD